MEVCVFFLRSIRRRLVTGFLVALGFMCIMTIAALWALQQHQIALSEIEFLAHKSPDKAQLLEKVNMILHPLLDAAKAVKERRTDLSREEIIFGLQNRYIKNVRAAQAEAKEFWERSEKINNDRGPGFSPQTKILQGNMEAVTRRLMALEVFEKEISSFATTAIDHRERQLHVTNYNVHAVLAEITFHLQRLPAYEKENYVLAKLRAKTAKSSLWQRRVWILAAISLVSYAITIFCGFQWISNPLRTIAHGASRIANGDTRFRLGSVTPWKDEFFDMVENFNRMADRFQESEDDLNAKVEERSRQLVRSERLANVGILAAGLAHEVNNPLQSITISAESLQMRLFEQLDPDDPDTAVAMDRLAMIQRESKRCGEITKRLLNFSRSDSADESTSGQLPTAPDDLTRIIGEVIAMVRPMHQYLDREIMFTRSDALFIEVNSSQIKQVMLNLIVNGLQATDSGGKVEIRIKDQTDWVVIDILDNGHGMTTRNIEQLFEPFYSTKETGQGTGLGLSITHRIIEDHHGTIDPSSPGPGLGSMFSIRLPRRQPIHRAA
jgi:two-component system NtrC family sensor kinase